MLINKKSPYGGDIYTNRVRLDFSANINPAGMPERVCQALIEAAGSCSAYPDPYCTELRKKIAESERVPTDNILCANGAAELIYQYAYALPKEKPALIISPAFCEYELALRAAGIAAEYYILREIDGFRLTEDILGTDFDRYSAVYLCSPNNPTGITVEPELICAIASSGVRLFCDFCFLDLTDAPEKYDIPALLRDYPNITILRAFTKSYAMAGVRLGYAMCGDPDFLAAMSEKAQCWNVSALAQAAGVRPSVLMNPILLKPTTDVGSQVIVNGEVRVNMRAADYFRYKRELIPDIMRAYDTLAADNDIIVIEGAGSPAEINLKSDDIVNMGMAKLAKAPVLLVGDIDRGGVFAQLYGTVALLEPEERAIIKATIINKFRGDVTILNLGLDMLYDLVKVPCAGVVPYTYIDIDDEDSLSERLTAGERKEIDIAVISLPSISNFTDFSPFSRFSTVSLRYVKNLFELGAPGMIIIPGTKSTISCLRWMRQNGLEAEILKNASRGTPVFGICGGLQMLG